MKVNGVDMDLGLVLIDNLANHPVHHFRSVIGFGWVESLRPSSHSVDTGQGCSPGSSNILSTLQNKNGSTLADQEAVALRRPGANPMVWRFAHKCWASQRLHTSKGRVNHGFKRGIRRTCNCDIATTSL